MNKNGLRRSKKCKREKKTIGSSTGIFGYLVANGIANLTEVASTSLKNSSLHNIAQVPLSAATIPSVTHSSPAIIASTTIAATVNQSISITATVNATTESAASEVTRSCAEWHHLFANLNHYFRDEDILQGSDHSRLGIGYVIIFAYSLVIAFGAIGNILTIAAVCRNPQMHTVRNFFILNLALSDFFICTVTAPITLYTVLFVFWPFGTASCKIVGSLQGFNIFLSTFSIAAIALDRYVLVIFPTQRHRQKNLALIFFLLIWLISILLALPLFAASDLDRVFQDTSCGILLTICHEKNQIWSQMILSKEMYTVAVLFIQYAFPLASIVFAYSRIARRMGMRFATRSSCFQAPNVAVTAMSDKESTTCDVPVLKKNSTIPNCVLPSDMVPNGNSAAFSKLVVNRGSIVVANCKAANPRNNSQSERNKTVAERHRRTNFLLISIVCVFAAAWLPLNIFHLFNTFSTGHHFSVPTFAFCHCLAICSACLNPVSYAFFNHHFRTEFAAIFESLKLKLVVLYKQN